MAETITSCMKHIPVSLRPDRSVCDLSFCAEKEAILVLSVGTQFIYIIPSCWRTYEAGES